MSLEAQQLAIGGRRVAGFGLHDSSTPPADVSNLSATLAYWMIGLIVVGAVAWDVSRGYRWAK